MEEKTTRNLTILRRKRTVACAGKDRVYVRDAQTPEVKILDVPCRLLGELKNGEEKTFAIGCDAQQIFVVAGKPSRFNAATPLEIPAGQEDVSYAGQNEFALGGNPFRFDGIAPTPAEKKLLKKNLVLILAISLIVGLISYFATNALMKSVFLKEADPCTFTKENFRITLTEDFTQVEEQGFFACYESSSAVVMVAREECALYEDMDLESYASLVVLAMERNDVQIQGTDDLFWITYTLTADGQEILYKVACLKDGGYYWLVNFATPATNRETYEKIFEQWAASIRLVAQAQAA